jgi:hypothetical protein
MKLALDYMCEFKKNDGGIMSKKASALTLLMFALAMTSGLVFSYEVDISGTWFGETEVPEQGTDEMTLVIEKTDGDYTATISDSFGLLMDTECEDLEYKNDTLSFNISIFDGSSDMTVHITLKVEGDTMTGYWETDDGNTGEITMEKQTG